MASRSVNVNPHEEAGRIVIPWEITEIPGANPSCDTCGGSGTETVTVRLSPCSCCPNETEQVACRCVPEEIALQHGRRA